MNLVEALRIALRALRANRLRSVLTTTGIILGVAAVIVLVALGNGIQAGFTSQFSSLTTQIQVTPSQDDRSAQPLTDSDVDALGRRNQAPDVATVTPVVSGSALLQFSDEELDAQLRRVRVFARVTPAQKVRIVRALQRAGDVGPGQPQRAGRRGQAGQCPWRGDPQRRLRRVGAGLAAVVAQNPHGEVRPQHAADDVRNLHLTHRPFRSLKKHRRPWSTGREAARAGRSAA